MSGIIHRGSEEHKTHLKCVESEKAAKAKLEPAKVEKIEEKKSDELPPKK